MVDFVLLIDLYHDPALLHPSVHTLLFARLVYFTSFAVSLSPAPGFFYSWLLSGMSSRSENKQPVWTVCTDYTQKREMHFMSSNLSRPLGRNEAADGQRTGGACGFLVPWFPFGDVPGPEKIRRSCKSFRQPHASIKTACLFLHSPPFMSLYIFPSSALLFFYGKLCLKCLFNCILPCILRTFEPGSREACFFRAVKWVWWYTLRGSFSLIFTQKMHVLYRHPSRLPLDPSTGILMYIF